jgi:hypothetical protein
VKTCVRVFSVFVLVFSLVGVASASFVLPSSETYVGYIGNLDIGRLDGSGGVNTFIGTDWISSPDMQDNTFVLNGTSDLDPTYTSTPVFTTHWYRFALNTPAQLMDFIELGENADLEISFFHDSAIYGDTPFETVIRNDSHNYQMTSSALFQSGTWWMQIEGKATSFASIDYKVRLVQAVPLPPAILLFGSALAGFGVLGRKKRQRISA